MKKAPSPKTRRVTISDQKKKMKKTWKEKEKGCKVLQQRNQKRKLISAHSTTSEEDEDTSSSEMDTDSGSEEVFGPNGPRFRVRGPWNKKAIVEFQSKKSHSERKFEDDDFDVLHADMSRA